MAKLQLQTVSISRKMNTDSKDKQFSPLQRSTVKACNKEAEPNFYGKLYLWRQINTIILQVMKMNQ